MSNLNQTTTFKLGMWKFEKNKPHLIGSKCNNCEELFFPAKRNNFCPHCHQSELKEELLSTSGIIKSYTIVNRRPAGGFYKGEVPYCYGVVTLPEGINILSLIDSENWNTLRSGDKVKLIIDELYEEDEKVLTYKFTTNLQKGLCQ